MTVSPTFEFDYVLLGGTGDLTYRKLLPALFHVYLDGRIDADSRIIGASRSALTTAQYREEVMGALRRHIPESEFDEEAAQAFVRHVEYAEVDAKGDHGWGELAGKLNAHGGTERIRVFYLATAPNLFGPICERLGAFGMVTERARVVLEKPIGVDLASARAINAQVGKVFTEGNIYRIDHYLGKETVQNLLALRFANVLFDPLWNSRYIDHIQITVAESIGLEGRGGYYDHSGALRDMVQNHLLQMLCLVAMEPPSRLEAESMRDEKVKVLQALAPITGADVTGCTVRGQYAAGVADGRSVCGYRQEEGISPDSTTETFVALKAEVRNWRWAGMPFYLRTGKRLPVKTSEIVIQFRQVPHSIFPAAASARMVPNRLVVKVQPNEGIHLHMMAKDPGPGGIRLRPAVLNLSFSETFKQRFPDAYERLLIDVVRGNPTLFMRRDEVEAAWGWVEPILAGWSEMGLQPRPYLAGTWGPSSSSAMIERDGRSWHDEV